MDRENHEEREEPFQNRKEKGSEKIIAESEKISADPSGLSSVVQNNAEQGEYPIREGRQITAVKNTERWMIM